MGILKKIVTTNTHVVDILGNVKGRDQPIMLMDKALQLVDTLPSEIFVDDEVVFFDPFCKAGEILLSCAFNSCIHKSKKNRKVLDVEDIQKELYESKRYYAIAPDERHHRLSLRTFLGNENSHKDEFIRIIRNGNYLSEVDGRLDEEMYQKEFDKMLEYIKQDSGKQKIIAVGNPPYQESETSDGPGAKSIYNIFAESLMDCKDIQEFVLVIPSRWFTSGKGSKKFRERVLGSTNIKNIRHFVNSKEVFPTVDVQGGICFFHYNANHDGKVDFTMDNTTSNVDLTKYDIILDDVKGYDLVEKVLSNWNDEFVSSIAWPVRPWAIRTFYFQRNKPLPDGHKDAVPCYSKGRKVMNANINDIPKNVDRIDEWKVAVPTGYSLGSRRVTLPPHQFFIVPKGYITTETYNIVGSFKKKYEAENFRNYLATNFGRYFLGLRKVTQHIYQKQWSWLPLVDVSQDWTDEKLFKMFKITLEEQKHIAKKLEEWS
ncbi:MAG: Eco57I restriction-modification methylase domain-containing protein [Bdellovibrionales bacterium]|nr:Eco57I restriction-modification methylase domain-containing protein [Bdellovibrionales bacterium]